MKRIFVAIALFGVLGCNQMNAQDGLTATEFEKRINTQHPQLLDVRTAGEYQNGHLAKSLQADWLNQAQFIDRIKYLDKSKPVLVYCASGMRSAAAAKYLLANGFSDVQNLKGGTTAWKLEGKPLEAVQTSAQLSVSKYNELSASADIVLVDFGAEWCPPCKQMEPVLKKLQDELGNKFSLIKVDGGIDIDVMKAMKVDAIPVFIVYKKGKEVWRKQGVVEKAELEKQLAK